MAKRIKRVFSNADQVIHIWANQSQNDARCKNAYFSGRSVFSYGSHYELGRLIEFNGVTLALINNRGYSVTTAKHINCAWNAVSHMFRLSMAGIDESPKAIEEALLRKQDSLINAFMNQLNRRKFYNNILDPDHFKYEMDAVKEFNKTVTALGFEHLTLEIDKSFFELMKDHIRICHARQAELKSPEHMAKQQAAALKRNAQAIEKWRSGGQLTQAVRSLRPMILRINGNEIQTSGGATVPVTDAVRLLKLIETKTAKAGERVGHFTLNNIDGDMVKIGCHTIALNEAKTVLSTFNQIEAVAA